VGECFFWYRLTRVVPDKFHRAVKWLCVCVLFNVSDHFDVVVVTAQLIFSNWQKLTVYFGPYITAVVPKFVL